MPSTSTWPGHRRRRSADSAARDGGRRRSRGTAADLMGGGDGAAAAAAEVGGDGAVDGAVGAAVDGGVGGVGAAGSRPGRRRPWTEGVCRRRRTHRHHPRRPDDVADLRDRPPGHSHRLRRPPDPNRPSTLCHGSARVTYFSGS